MLENIVLIIAAVVFTIIILVLLRIYKNTRVVESPENIVQQIKALSSDLDAQGKQMEEIMTRIQRSESTFARSIGQHIDDSFQQMGKEVDVHFQNFSGQGNALVTQFGEMYTKVTSLEGSLNSMQDFVAEQKAQIRRMHEGYDWSIISAICLDLIKLVDDIDSQLAKTNGSSDGKALASVRQSIVAMLGNYDVKELAPKVGATIDEKEQDSYQVIKVESGNAKDKGKIARVLKPSYVYTSSKDGTRVIRGAEIEVYS